MIACGSSCSRRAATAGGYAGFGYTYADIATARFVRDHRVCGLDAFDVPANVLRQAPGGPGHDRGARTVAVDGHRPHRAGLPTAVTALGAVAVVAAGLAMAARTRR